MLPQNDSIPFEGYHEPFYDDRDVPDIWGSECDIDTSSEEDDPGTMFSQIQLQEAAQKLAETALEAAISGAVADVIQVCCLLDFYMLASSSCLHDCVASVRALHHSTSVSDAAGCATRFDVLDDSAASPSVSQTKARSPCPSFLSICSHTKTVPSGPCKPTTC